MASLADWTGARCPGRDVLEGGRVRLEPLGLEHADELHAAGRDAAIWDYLPYGPWPEAAAWGDWVRRAATSEDPWFYAVRPRDLGTAAGVVSFLRCEPAHGSIEIGHIWFGAGLARTAAATEAILLLAAHAFEELGHRRLEWKCNAANAASRRAAERFGFTYEGTFRQHMVVKGANRDTAWFAIVDGDWPARRAAYERWLDPANFDARGRQRAALAT